MQQPPDPYPQPQQQPPMPPQQQWNPQQPPYPPQQYQQPPQYQPPMLPPKKKSRKRLWSILAGVFQIIFLIVFLTVALIIAGFLWLQVRQLESSGIAVQGKIVNVDPSNCEGYGWFGDYISVQFTDQAGQVDTSSFSQCDYGHFYVNPGESITIVYDPIDPSNIAPRDALARTYLMHTLITVAIGLFELALLLGLPSVWMVRRIRKQRKTRSMSDPT